MTLITPATPVRSLQTTGNATVIDQVMDAFDLHTA
jgi:hypothetical protein